MALIYQTG